jgi:hypothetical protein
MRKRDCNAIANRFSLLAQRAETLLVNIQNAGFGFEQNSKNGVTYTTKARDQANDLMNDLSEALNRVREIRNQEEDRNYWRRMNREMARE